MKHKILFVDDEKNVLLSIKRIFRTTDFELLTADSGKDAITILKETNVSIIISDMKMPEMTGSELLKEAMKIRPDAIRIILSGHSEAENIMDAINEGSIWRFISKPWHNNELIMTLRNASELYERKIEKNKLIIALKEKTDQLNSMNKLLEQKVKQKTWLLNERSQLLTMLVEDQGIEVTLWRVCSSISKFLSGKPVFIIPSFLEHIYTVMEGDARGGKLSPSMLELGSTVLKDGKTTVREGSLGILLRKNNTKLGVLLIRSISDEDGPKIEKSISSFISFLEIALFQYKLSKNTPELIENIDKLMGYV
ncbi:MAG: response regulator [Spirochaetia bacterium]|jgi:FixJ family two-component response regulator|nr:response regulator [Spirochaetia bacterium]